MRKGLLLAFTLVLGMAWAAPASAATTTIQFDPDGSGAVYSNVTVNLFDWAPGNTLLIEDVDPISGLPTGTGTILFQANLATIDTTGLFDVLNGAPGADQWFTAVAGYGVIIDQTTTPGTTLFYLDTSASSFFNIYVNSDGNGATSEAGNNLTGSCFVCGTQILSGTAIAQGFSSSFVPTSTSGGALDQSPNGDQYPGVTTILGSGSTQINVTVDSWDANYFTNLTSGMFLMFTNTSTVAPYSQVDPSRCFDLDGLAPAVCEPGATSVGSVNGLGTRIVLQADANSSFATNDVVPEPATLTLLGLGLLGSAAARRRQLKKKQQSL